ncbi:MAG: M24 family metallopeptidase [Syntrophomonadaceae bacterium]|nr:M24 family metallopeptidase [Syntrophomonadaceae bacterium]
MLAFEVAEYKERIRKVKESMSEKGIDVLLITDPANMNYLTGYDGWSFYVHQMLILMMDAEEPIWVGRGQDGNGAKMTTWLKDENIMSYTDDYIQSLTKHPMEFVAGIVKEKGKGNQVIGVEMEAYYFTAKCFERLQASLPNATLKDATLLINWVRVIKSEQEIAYIRKATRIVEKAMQVAVDSLGSGIRECDVAANIFHAQISGTEEYGGDYCSIIPLIPSGERTRSAHLSWDTDRRYEKGDQVNLELAACYKRYHSPLARTAIVGKPADRLIAISETVIEGIGNALAAVKPGLTCEEVEEVWRKTIAKSGFIKDSRIGYSMGLNYPPDWGEHTASFRPGDKTVLKPNMTFHMIPGIWMDDIGFEVSQTFRVTGNGCEIFSDFPRKLFIKD